jgi:D-alanyl-D-alanine carboxypeptidase
LISFVSYSIYSKTSQEDVRVISPIPDFLSIANNNQVSSLSLWLPILTNFITGNSDVPQITAKSALVYDITTNKVLYEKNPKEKLPMASLTKITTAIVALENKKSDDKYFVNGKDLVGEDSMGLTQGEILSLKELLYGLILTSGNDAGEVIASNYKNGREAFIKAMNDKAKALGVSDTNFTNPTGLEGDGNQHTSAYDLVVITRYALEKFSLFRQVVATFDHNIPQTSTHKAYFLENETNLITSYPGVKGVKTGYTPEAGFCLVTYLDFEGHQIIGVILGSQNRREEMKELLDYSLKSINIKPPSHG